MLPCKNKKILREKLYTLESDNQSCTRDKIRIILRMMGAANEMPNPSLKWQDLAIQKLNCHRNSIFGETKKKFGISTQEPGRIASFLNTLVQVSQPRHWQCRVRHWRIAGHI